MHEILANLCATIESALDDQELLDDFDRAEVIREAMLDVIASPECVPIEFKQPHNGGGAGYLLHDDPEGRFHILSIVFPPEASSGTHYHGCWGVIGYMHGRDEETRYRIADGGQPKAGDQVDLVEISRITWEQGDVVYLLPPDDGWHRVRNPGPDMGVTVHVLCMRPAEHPHLYWDRNTRLVKNFPFREPVPGVWRAEVED